MTTSPTLPPSLPARLPPSLPRLPNPCLSRLPTPRLPNRQPPTANPQVDNMTNKHAIFMTRDGRISLAGLNSAKVEYLADAIVDSVRNH